jgi:sensor histidine kinase YesM
MKIMETVLNVEKNSFIATPPQVEAEFRFEVAYWQIWVCAVVADVAITYLGGFSGIIHIAVCLGYSIIYSHIILGCLLGTQAVLFPLVQVRKNVFLKKTAILLAVCFVVIVGFQIADYYLWQVFLNSKEFGKNISMEPMRFNILVTWVSISITTIMIGLNSAQNFFRRLEETLTREAEARKAAYDAQVKVQESELKRQHAEWEMERATKLATEAELSALKMQINPHFFFNTLNSIAALSHLNPEKASATTERLAEMFHYTLQASKREATTLVEEMEFLKAYLEIERARFGDRIKITIDVPSEFNALHVPNLLLQPIVENAVAHAFKDMDSGCTVSLVAERTGDTALITIADNGKGFGQTNPYASIGKGTALKNIDERLRKSFGSEYGLVIEANQPAGAVFKIKIPITRSLHPID